MKSKLSKDTRKSDVITKCSVPEHKIFEMWQSLYPLLATGIVATSKNRVLMGHSDLV